MATTTQKVLEMLETSEMQVQIAQMIFDSRHNYPGKFLVDIDIVNKKLSWGYASSSTSENPANLYPNTNFFALPDYIIREDDEDAFEREEIGDCSDIPYNWISQYVDDCKYYLKCQEIWNK